MFEASVPKAEDEPRESANMAEGLLASMQELCKFVNGIADESGLTCSVADG